VIKTSSGFDTFMWPTTLISDFLNYSDPGAKMVFGDEIFDYFTFAFRIMPTIIFFSAAVNVLYYLGVLQIFISGISWLMHVTLGTSAPESFSSAGSIFLGQTESALLIRPYLNTMSQSEINTVMTSGFATISSSVLMLYIKDGIQPHHLLTASVMSAPAAIAVAKIICPETEEKASSHEQTYLDQKEEVIDEIEASNFLDAISNGALQSIYLVANICVLLIAFMGAIEFANNCIGYLGERVGLVEDDKLSFTKLCGWLFYPMSWLMGVPDEDCFRIGELLGYKIFTSELVAYKKMICMYQDNSIGERSAYIATYALSGFSSIGAIGIQLGGLLPLAPDRKQDILRLAFRAMLAGNIACFMTACVAGILVDKEPIQDYSDMDCPG